MNRHHLAQLLKQHTDLTSEEAQWLVREFFEAIAAGLANDGRVELRGFGVFKTTNRNQAGFFNPKNQSYYGGRSIQTVRFTPSKKGWDLSRSS